MTMRVLVLAALISLCVVLVEGQTFCNTYGDGCSIPLGLDFPYKSTFKPACNRHDMCYSCGSGRGVTRAVCDTAFRNDMKSICDSSRTKREASFLMWIVCSVLKTNTSCVAGLLGSLCADLWSKPDPSCYDYAEVYYSAVNRCGQSSYSSTDLSYCSLNETAVRGCLPSY